MSEHDTGVLPASPPPGGRIVAGLFDRREDGEAMVELLHRQGWGPDRLGLIHRSDEAAPGESTSEGKEEGIAAGALLGGVAGVALGLMVLAIPGVGAFVAAGPLAVALAGVAGSAVGGLTGSFAGLGIPEADARDYEEAVHGGGYFVLASVPSEHEAKEVRAIFEAHDAQSINSYAPDLEDGTG